VCLVRLKIGLQTEGARRELFLVLLHYLQKGTRDELIVGWVIVLLRELIRSVAVESAAASATPADIAWLKSQSLVSLLLAVDGAAESDFLRLLVCDCFFTFHRFLPIDSDHLLALLGFLLRVVGNDAILAPTAVSILVFALETHPESVREPLLQLLTDSTLTRFASMLCFVRPDLRDNLRTLLGRPDLFGEATRYISIPPQPPLPLRRSTFHISLFQPDSYHLSLPPFSSSSSSSSLSSSSFPQTHS
jgi:hypothetical protein